MDIKNRILICFLFWTSLFIYAQTQFDVGPPLSYHGFYPEPIPAPTIFHRQPFITNRNGKRGSLCTIIALVIGGLTFYLTKEDAEADHRSVCRICALQGSNSNCPADKRCIAIDGNGPPQACTCRCTIHL